MMRHSYHHVGSSRALLLFGFLGAFAIPVPVSAQVVVLDPVPRAFPESTSPSGSLAAGDVDTDGDLDVAFANSGLSTGSNTLYFNAGDGFPDVAGWLSDPGRPRYSAAAAFGDLDGDGDPDLLFGNKTGFGSTFYWNTGGTLDELPSPWDVEVMSDTRAVALCDFDRDGHQDVVLGNLNGVNTIYRGTATGPEAIPFWRSVPSVSTQAVAWGDING